MPNKELRSIALEVTAENTKGDTLSGVIPFNTQSEMLCEDGQAFVEVLAPGAFHAAPDVRALINHADYPVLGRLANGTLTLEQKDDGLYVTVALPKTHAAEDLYVSVQRGDIKGMSFAFFVNPNGESWDYTVTPPIRTLTNITIDEVSFVGNPAYSDTTAAARNLSNGKKESESRRLINIQTEHEIERELIEIQKQL